MYLVVVLTTVDRERVGYGSVRDIRWAEKLVEWMAALVLVERSFERFHRLSR